MWPSRAFGWPVSRIIRWVMVIVLCAVAAQAQEPGGQAPPQSPVSSPAGSTQNPITNPPPVPSPDVTARAVAHRVPYVCDNNVHVLVIYRRSSARVFYNKHVYEMKHVVSADGGRYSDGQLVWWNVGKRGSLANAEDDRSSTSALLAANCHEDATRASRPHAAQEGSSQDGAIVAAATTSGWVTGTVSYLQRIAMPPTALVDVQLRVISRADAPARIVAEQKIDFGDRQVPVPFDLKFDPAKINAQHRYGVRATIVVDGPVRFRSDTTYPFITHGHSSKADLILKQVVEAPTAQH